MWLRAQVHRDVKPQNLVLVEAERRFKLIDLGACADLRTGANFSPDEVDFELTASTRKLNADGSGRFFLIHQML